MNSVYEPLLDWQDAMFESSLVHVLVYLKKPAGLHGDAFLPLTNMCIGTVSSTARQFQARAAAAVEEAWSNA